MHLIDSTNHPIDCFLPVGLRRAARFFAFALVAAVFLLCSFSTANAAVERVCNKSDLRKALNAAGPGDTIEMCAQTWNNVSIEFDATGTMAKPVVLRAETPGKTILTGATRIVLAGTHLVVDGLVIRGEHTLLEESPRTRIIEFRGQRRPGVQLLQTD